MKLPLIIFYVVCQLMSSAQQPVVFLPHGAKWHYDFYTYDWSYGGAGAIVDKNKTIEYTRDTIINNETLKMISYQQFFMGSCYWCTAGTTYLKQRGDTIFLKNGCYQDWQVLYNFATPVGDQWTFSAGSAGIFTVSVQSVQTVTINNTSLKQLSTSIHRNNGINESIYTETMTERIGGSYFFYFRTGSCDGDDFHSLLCYEDDSFPLYQPSDKPCNYTTVGIEKYSVNSDLIIYPNPTSKAITIKTQSHLQDGEIVITDLLDRIVQGQQKQKVNDETEIDVSQLQAGIYFLQIIDQGKLVARRKIIKD